MPTAYAFTTEQLEQIGELRRVLAQDENRATASAAVPLYSYVFQCVTGLEVPQNTPLDFLSQPFVSGVLASLPADQRASAIWLYGAIQVNSDNGVFSDVIRQYNIRQGVARGRCEFSDEELQRASNQVGVLLASSILNATDNFGAPNVAQGRLPTVQEIGASDLLGVRNVLYPGNEQAGSELYLNQAWPGIVMLGALGGQYTDRLLRWDESNQAIELDSLADFKSLLLCWDAFKTAFSSTLVQSFSVSAISDFLIGLNLLPAVVSQSLDALRQNGAASFAQLVFSALIQPQNATAGAALNLMARLDGPQVLDMPMGARDGVVHIGETTAANFLQRAERFFSRFSSQELSGVGATMLPIDAPSLAQLASLGNVEGLKARAALAALSPFAADVAPEAAARLALFDPATGQGQITPEWIEDRAKVHAAFNLYWRRGETDGVLSVTDLGLDIPFGQWGDTWVVVEGANGAKAQTLTIDGFDLGVALATLRYFGNDEANQRAGGDAPDRLYGGAGSDNYVIDGSAGCDTLIDADGGTLRYLDRALSDGQETAPGSGEWQDGAVRYRLMPEGDRQNLLISAGAGTVLVQNWRKGHIGIQLQDAPAVPPADLVINGDLIVNADARIEDFSPMRGHTCTA